MVFVFCRTQIVDTALKVSILIALPTLFGLWLGLGIAGSVLVGIGYGFFTPCVSTFEAFRHDNESKKFMHCIVVRFYDQDVLFISMLIKSDYSIVEFEEIVIVL
jgi:hypothetical protein